MADVNSRAGARSATPAIVTYVDTTHAAHDPALQRAFTAPEQHGLPAIQVAPSEGKTLTLLMRLLDARKVVEVGTLAGYSALRIARGLSPGGKLWTFELDPKHAQVARDNLAAAGMEDRVEVRVGPALQQLAGIETHGPFDAVFIDADKSGYPDYARWAQRHLRPGGLLIGDNAYYFGQLLSDKPEAARMREFHEFVAQHFDSVCLPTPDGLVLGLARSTHTL
jgi:caffeoyl-CoA O-methyltransferase